MIKTRYGSEVTILWGDVEKGIVKIEYKDGFQFQTYIHELRADGDVKEISEMINLVMGKPKPELTVKEKAWLLEDNICPDCGYHKFSKGPQGGNSTNIMCRQCGSKFNVSLPFFVERI